MTVSYDSIGASHLTEYCETELQTTLFVPPPLHSFHTKISAIWLRIWNDNVYWQNECCTTKWTRLIVWIIRNTCQNTTDPPKKQKHIWLGKIASMQWLCECKFGSHGISKYVGMWDNSETLYFLLMDVHNFSGKTNMNQLSEWHPHLSYVVWYLASQAPSYFTKN